MVAIYCRISGKKAKGKDVSIEVQKQAGIEFANKLGENYELYIDEGISGAKSEIEERPEFSQMFKDIKNEKISAVYSYDQSRIVRQSRIWHIFVYALEKSNCKYYIADEEVDLNDPETKLITGIIALVDELYTETTSRKVKAANRANAKKGKGHGITAYGYKKDDEGYLKINENQAKIVRDIFEMSYRGVGTYTIANELNRLGVPTKSSEFKGRFISKKDKYTKRVTKHLRDDVAWRGNVIRDMITNPVYKGIRKYGDVFAQIPIIIEPEFWDKVNKNLVNNRRNVGPKTKFNYLLNGIIFCAECGSEYRGKIKASGRNTTYYCKGKSQGESCGSQRGLNIPRLESFILNHLFESGELHNKLSNLKADSDKVEKLQVEISQLNEKKKDIAASQKHMYKLMLDPRVKDDVRDDYLNVKNDFETIEAQIEVKEKELAMQSQVKRKERLDKIFGEFDYTLNFDQIKKSVHMIIESIHVQHLPEQKNFLIQLNYRGFDRKSVFATDHSQMRWINMSHYEVVPLTEEDINNQDDLIDYFAEKDNWSREKLVSGLKHFKVWSDEFETYSYPELLNEIKKLGHKEMVKDGQKSVINIETSNIKLMKDQLYNFNA